MITVGGQQVQIYRGSTFQPRAVVVGSIIRWVSSFSFNGYRPSASSGFTDAVANLHNAVLGGNRTASSFSSSYSYLPFNVTIASGRTGSTAYWFTPGSGATSRITDIYTLRLGSGYEYRRMYGSRAFGANVEIYRALTNSDTHLDSFAHSNNNGRFEINVASDYSGRVYGNLGINGSYNSNRVISRYSTNQGSPSLYAYNYPTSLNSGEENILSTMDGAIPSSCRQAGTTTSVGNGNNKIISNIPPLGEAIQSVPRYRQSTGTVYRNYTMHVYQEYAHNSSTTYLTTGHSSVRRRRIGNSSWRDFTTSGSGIDGTVFGYLDFNTIGSIDPDSVMFRIDIDSAVSGNDLPIVIGLPMRDNGRSSTTGNVAVRITDTQVLMYIGGFRSLANNTAIGGQLAVSNLSSSQVGQPITVIASVNRNQFIVRVYQTSTRAYLGHRILNGSFWSMASSARNFQVGGNASFGLFGMGTNSRKFRNLIHGSY